MIFATSQDAPQLDPISTFFAQYGMLLLLLALIVFMFWSSRRRSQRMKTEQETKQRSMLPGAKVLLQGGLYGTLVSFDADDLSRPAFIELAPGVQVEVHSQAVLRVVDPEEEVSDEDAVEADAVGDGPSSFESGDVAAVAEEPAAVTPVESKPDADDKSTA